MKIKFVIATVVALSVGLIVTNCKKEVKTITPKTTDESAVLHTEHGDIELYPNTKHVKGLDIEKLISITSNELIYSGESDFLNSIKVGDILITAIPCEIAPDGYLREVKSIDKTGDKYIFNTINSTLDKAIKKCDLVVTAPVLFPEENSQNQTKLLPGGSYTTSKTFPTNFVLFDRDKNNSTTIDQVRLNGSFVLGATVTISITTSGLTGSTLQFFRTQANLSITNSATITIGGTMNLPKRTAKIFSFNTAPSIPIGSIISFKPIIDCYADFNGSVTAQCRFGYSGSVGVAPSIRFQSGAWNAFFPNPTRNLTLFKPSTNLSATFQVGLRPRLTLALYGCVQCASAYIEGTCYGRFTCSNSAGPKLEVGLTAGVGAQLFGYTKDYPDFTKYVLYTN